MSDRHGPYSTVGHLTVQRSLNNGTYLTEIWVLEHLYWENDEIKGDHMPLRCYVVNLNSSPKLHHGIPHSDDSVSASCSFDDAPEDIQREFIEQMGRIGKLNYRIDPNTEVGNEDE